MAEWIKWALVSARTKWQWLNKTADTHTCTHASPHTRTHIDTKQHRYHMSAPNILYHRLPSHPSLNENFVFLCGAFWDCGHQYTCYTSLEYPGFTPRGNAASSGPPTLTLYILTFLESTAERYFPSIQLGKTSHKTGAPPCTANSSRVFWHSPHFLHLWCEDDSPALALSLGTGQLFGSPDSSSAYFTAGLTVYTHRWALAVCSGHLWCRSHSSCEPSEYWGSRSLFLSSTALIFEFILIKIN